MPTTFSDKDMDAIVESAEVILRGVTTVIRRMQMVQGTPADTTILKDARLELDRLASQAGAFRGYLAAKRAP